MGRDILNKVSKFANRCFGTTETQTLPVFQGLYTSSFLKQDPKAMFCGTAKLLLMVELKVNQAIDETESLGTPVSVEAGGVENCSPVVWEKIRRSADYKVHVIDELNEYNTEAYPLPYTKTTSQKETDDKKFSNIDSSIAYWNTALDEKTQDACTMNIRPSFFKLLDQSKG